VLGAVSYRKLPVNLMPEIAYPSLTVRTEFPGSAPEEVEKLITEPIEQQLGVLGNLVSIRSISRAGFSDVQLEFRWGTSMAHLVSEIREKLDQVGLPKEAKTPLILRYDPSLDPVMTLGISGLKDQAQLRRLAIDEVQHKIGPLNGVAAAEVEGGLIEEVVVDLNEAKLSARNLTISQISQRLAAENLNMAGGVVRDGQNDSVLRTVNEFRSIADIENTVIKRVNGASIRIRDVAAVRRGFRRPEVITRVGGRRAVQLAIYKEATANIISVADEVRAKLTQGPKALDKTLAGRVKIEIISDNSRFIRMATEEVRTTALIGGLLAMVVLYCFLGSLPNTLIISLAIPLSVVATFIPMRLFDVSLNVMSLGGLALGIGMLVDNSIVVLESIYRAREEGLEQLMAALVGTQRVAGAVTASTLTTVAVFFPIAFVEGIAGQIFRDQALTVVCSLLASLIVSLAFIPMLAGRRLPDPEERYTLGQAWTQWACLAQFQADFEAINHRYAHPLALYHALRLVVAGYFELMGKILALISFALFYIGLGLLLLSYWIIWGLLWPFQFAVRWLMQHAERIYPRGLEAAIKHPALVLGLLLAVIATCYTLGGRLGSELIPEVKQGELLVHIDLPVGTPLERTNQVIGTLEQQITQMDEIATIDTRVGIEKKATSDPSAGEHTARLRLRLKPGLPPGTEDRLIDRIRLLVRANPHVDSLRFARPTLLSLRYPVAVEIRGDETGELTRASSEVAEVMRRQPGLTDVRLTQKRGSPELHIHYDRERLTQFGLDIRQVAETVRKKVHGEQVTRVRWGGQKIDLRIKLRRQDVSTRAALSNLRVDAGGDAVAKRLGEVARIDRRSGPSEVRHIGHQRATVIEARVSGIDLGSSAKALKRDLARLSQPEGISFEVAGQNREMQASSGSLYFALGLALFLVYVVMASQFESVLQPLVIMLTVPLAALGVVLALWALTIPVSVIVLIGGIVLAGIVVNNAIVLVDAINQELAGGAELLPAVLTGARTRLRPVLMTTLTTVLGLLPLTGVFGQPTGAELRMPLAVTIIAGLLSATVLTLVVIPVFYGWLSRRPQTKTDQPPETETPLVEMQTTTTPVGNGLPDWLACHPLVKHQYRQGVTMIVRNDRDELLWCERSEFADSWQFPQGGVDEGESHEQAMWRELSEELGLQAPQKLLRIERRLEQLIPYTYPSLVIERLVNRGFHSHIGQEQQYFLLRFEGDDTQITLEPPEGIAREFSRFTWTGPERVALAPSFKRDAMTEALKAFDLW